MNGLNKVFISMFVAILCVGGLAGCSSGDEGGDNAEGVKKLANDPSNSQNNNPDIPPLSKEELSVTGKPSGK